MKLKLVHRLFLPTSVVLALVTGLGTSYRLFGAAAAPFETGDSCGGGSFKEDDWSDGETERSRSWADTPGFNCTHGVANAQVQIKASQYEGGPNACFGFDWDENGWSVFEKWQTEEEKNENGCQDISNVVITWTCECPPPTATATSTDPATATATETATNTATPTETNTPGGPTETPTFTATEGPSPTASPTQPTHEATPTDKPGGSGGGEGPSNNNGATWLVISIAITIVTYLGWRVATNLRRKASLL